jgi:hypothetical protein
MRCSGGQDIRDLLDIAQRAVRNIGPFRIRPSNNNSSSDRLPQRFFPGQRHDYHSV